MHVTFDRDPSPDPTVQLGQEDILEARSLVPPLPSMDPTVQLGQEDILEARSLLDPPPPPVLDTTVLQELQGPPPRDRSLLGLMVPGGIDDELNDLTIITDRPPRRVWRTVGTLILGLVPVLGIAAAIAAQDYLFSSSGSEPAAAKQAADVPIRVHPAQPDKEKPRIIHAKRPAKRRAVTARPLALKAKAPTKVKAKAPTKAKAKAAVAKVKTKTPKNAGAKAARAKAKTAKVKAAKVKVAKAKAARAKAKARAARASKGKRRPARLAMRARKATPAAKGTRQSFARLRRHLAAAGRAVQKQQWKVARRHIQKARRIDRRNKTARILALRVRKGMARERQVDRFLSSARRALKVQQWKRAKRQAARALRLDPRNRRAKKIKRVADLRLRKAKRQTG
jgi:hypothetical protein